MLVVPEYELEGHNPEPPAERVEPTSELFAADEQRESIVESEPQVKVAEIEESVDEAVDKAEEIMDA